jgi:hypothetical protein
MDFSQVGGTEFKEFCNLMGRIKRGASIILSCHSGMRDSPDLVSMPVHEEQRVLFETNDMPLNE